MITTREQTETNIAVRTTPVQLLPKVPKPLRLQSQQPKSALEIETINHRLCKRSLHDVNDIKLDIEILQSTTDALQSLANAQEGYSSIIDNSSKIELLEQGCLEEREKVKKIELDLIDIKRILCEMQEREQQQRQQQQQSINYLITLWQGPRTIVNRGANIHIFMFCLISFF